MILWLLALLAAGLTWGGYWRFRIKPLWLAEAELADEPADSGERLSVIIPARNEARLLPGLLAALATEGPADMEIVVVDDHSIDGTSACVREAALADPRVHLVPCPPKPDTWSGKNWAVAQGVAHASGEWLIFCDADVRIRAGAMAGAMALARRETLDALSLIPGMEDVGFGPAFLLACFAVSRALLFRPAAPGRRGLAQGAFLVVRRAAYDAVNGHAVDTATLLEDVELGYRLCDAGFRVRSYPARRWVRAKMYESLDETSNGLSKHLFASLAFSWPRLAAVLGLHLFLFLFPFVSMLVALFLAMDGGLAMPELAVLLMSGLCLAAMYVVTGQLVRAELLPWISALALPLSYFGMGAVLAASVSGYRRGYILWKGRRYERRCGGVGLQ